MVIGNAKAKHISKKSFFFFTWVAVSINFSSAEILFYLIDQNLMQLFISGSR